MFFKEVLSLPRLATMTRAALRRKDFFNLNARVASRLDSAEEINSVVNNFMGMNAKGGGIVGVESECNVETTGLIILRNQNNWMALHSYAPRRQDTPARQAHLEIFGRGPAVKPGELQTPSGN